MKFEEFPKIGRLTRDMVITEKIDGTNAQIAILAAAEIDGTDAELARSMITMDRDLGLVMLAGSRSQYITPERDNFGFAQWVQEHSDELWALGSGRHFGEWWGAGIQRRYGLTEKRFSLFNVGRWVSRHGENPPAPSGKQEIAPACCHVVPVLKRWTFNSAVIDDTLAQLAKLGSHAAPGFMQPEGIVVFHSASGTLYKRTLEKDDEPKSRSARTESTSAVPAVAGSVG